MYEKIESLASKRGMSISKLEKQAGLSKATISKWRKSSPRVDNLQAVAKVLHVKIDKLLEE